MAATIDAIRLQKGDIKEPYLFDDATIQQALDEAAATLEAEGVDINTTIGRRAHKLQASIFLLSSHLGRIKERPIKSIREGDAAIEYFGLSKQVDEWKDELRNIILKLQDPLEAVYDNF